MSKGGAPRLSEEALAATLKAGRVRVAPQIRRSADTELLRLGVPAKLLKPKCSKHRSVKTVVDGITFHSKLEAGEWVKLRAREQAGEIRNLRRQVRFSLFAPGGEHLGTYAADFVFDARILSNESKGGWFWGRVVADAKSAHTRKLPGWNRTKTLMRACHSIEILELPWASSYSLEEICKVIG